MLKGCAMTNLNHSALCSLHASSYEYRIECTGNFNVYMHDAIVYQTHYRGGMHHFDISKRDRCPILYVNKKHLDFSSTFQCVQGHSGKAGTIKVLLEVS